MKRYLIILSALALSSVAFAQERPDMGNAKKDFSFSPQKASAKQEIEKTFHDATIALKNAPDDKTTQGNYIKALRTRMEYKAKMDSLKQSAIEMRKSICSDEAAALQKAKKDLSSAMKEMAANLNSYEKQKAVVAAQKAVFVAEKAAAPLILVDGKECSSMDEIDRNDIKKFTMVKNEEMTKKYGDKAKNGVVNITTKQTANAPAPDKAPGNAMQKPANGQRVPMDQMRIQHIIKTAGITDKQKDSFTKVYNQYTNEIETLRRNANKLTDENAKATSSSIENIFKNNITIEQKRMDMYKELGKTLSAEQLLKVYRADIDFAKMMMNHFSRNNGQQNNNQRPQNGNNRSQMQGGRPQMDGGFQNDAF
ncbi:MAG: hypothetical protein PHD21_02250 [Flavobacteriales bacterium]|nr:hypothetical protein [Flavobacteriales bacterium]